MFRQSFHHIHRVLCIISGAAIAGICLKSIAVSEITAIGSSLLLLICFYLAFIGYMKKHDALNASEAKFRSSFDHAPIGMAIVSDSGEWVQINDRLRKILSLDHAEMPAEDYRNVIFIEDLPTFENHIAELIEGKTPSIEIETRLIDQNGNIIWTLLGASKAIVAGAKNFHIIFQFQDINSRKEAEAKLRHDAAHDSLTNLSNRAAFSCVLQETIDRSKTSVNVFFAVLFIDLDNFKLINDALGHNIGDEILKATAARLLESVHGHDTVARPGGDEFTILLENLSNAAEADSVAERILSDFSKPLKLPHGEFAISLSIGIAVSGGNYANADDMLRDADAAMYKSKSLGKNRFSVFDAGMFAQTTRALQVINDLPRGIKNNQIVIHYQSILDLRTNRIIGFEALSRWQHPVHGLIPPLEFVPLAEEYGIINQLDNWVMLNASKKLKEWQNSGDEFRELFISVNVSSKQFAQAGFVEYVKSVLETTGLSFDSLQIEITESALIQNMAKTLENLGRLNLLGVKVALDDFGTGYSSLSYLRELPISVLKIDRAFVKGLETNPDDIEILRTIVALASKLRMKVTAEGIETVEQLGILCEMDCNYGQGFYFSHPINAEETFKYLTSNNTLQSETGSQSSEINLPILS